MLLGVADQADRELGQLMSVAAKCAVEYCDDISMLVVKAHRGAFRTKRHFYP